MSCAVVVCGMDTRYKLWVPFKHGFDKYWPDCPWDKYFITNLIKGPVGFKTIITGHETSWGNKAIRALMQIDTDIVFFLMEDAWLPGPVDTEAMVKFYKIMMDNPKIDHIRMVPPTIETGTVSQRKELTQESPYDARLWSFKMDAEWRASIMAPFWRRRSLLSYLSVGQSVWDFEDSAGALSSRRDTEHLCCIDPHVFPLPHRTNPYQTVKDEMVTKGRWNKAAYEYIKKEQLAMNFKVHPNGEPNEDKLF